VIGGSISSTLLTLILVPVVYNFFDWGSGLIMGLFRAISGASTPVDKLPEEEKAPEREPGPVPPPRPSPQPGSAFSLSAPSQKFGD
jgi:hypothetical protein